MVLLPVGLAAADAGSQPAGDSTPSGQQHQRLLLRSQPFSLSSENEEPSDGSTSSSSTHLVLTTPPPPPARGGGLWRSSSSSSAAADATGGWGKLECRLGARVAVQHYPVAGGTASATAVTVTVTAGCFVSNLSGLPLEMLVEGAAAEAEASPAAADGSDGAQQPAATGSAPTMLILPHASTARSLPSGGSIGVVAEEADGEVGAARRGVPLPHTATLPLVRLWQADGAAGSGSSGSKKRRQPAQQQRSWGSTSDVLRSFSSGLLPSGPHQSQQQAGSSRPALRFALTPADPAAPGAAQAQQADWSAALEAFAAAGRQRLYLQQPAAAPAGSCDDEGHCEASSVVMLTYRVLLSGGSFHLVLFRCTHHAFFLRGQCVPS